MTGWGATPHIKRRLIGNDGEDWPLTILRSPPSFLCSTRMRMRGILQITPERENVVLAVILLGMVIFDAVVWLLLVK